MHQTRQFTKRRPQSPSVNQQQQQSVDALQVGTNKPTPPRSGLAIQSAAPLYVSNHSSSHHHSEEHGHHHHEHEAHEKKASLINPYAPSVTHEHNHRDHSGHAHGHHYEHNHSNHLGHTHDHHDHDHSHTGHTHQHQDHAHNHSHFGNDHQHGHDHQHQIHNQHQHEHDHSGHGHDHQHNFAQVYTQPLPSYSVIFATLTPNQKALFIFFLGHFTIGIIVWWLGTSRESLAIAGFSYLVLFDSFGTLNNFVSSVLDLNPAFTATNTKRPFGVKRFEIVFALANTIFLLFGTMYTTKESLEHLLLEGNHGGDHHGGKSSIPFGLLFMLLLAIGASFGSNVSLRNHGKLMNLRNKSGQMQQDYSYNSDSPFDSLKKNIYSLSIVSTGFIVFLIQLFNLTSPTLDKILAFCESVLMFYLGGPAAATLAKVLLQTMPDSIISKVDYNVRQVQQNPNIISVDKIHFWQNSYGKCIGTAEVLAGPESNEDEVLEATFNILENLVHDNQGGGELTISVTKKE